MVTQLLQASGRTEKYSLFQEAMCKSYSKEGRSGNGGASQVALVAKNPPANAGNVRDVGLIHGLGRSPGGGNGNSLQYSCLGNPKDRRAWWATGEVARESDTTL